MTNLKSKTKLKEALLRGMSSHCQAGSLFPVLKGSACPRGWGAQGHPTAFPSGCLLQARVKGSNLSPPHTLWNHAQRADEEKISETMKAAVSHSESSLIASFLSIFLHKMVVKNENYVALWGHNQQLFFSLTSLLVILHYWDITKTWAH